MSKYYSKTFQRSVLSKDCLKECPLCEFTTQSETAIKLHFKYVHKKIATNAATNYMCGECSKNFNTKEELTTHLKKHVKHVKTKKY